MTVNFVDMEAQYVDHMGNDLSVVNAARVSFDKRSEWEYPVIGSKQYESYHNGSEFTLPVYGERTLSKKDRGLIKYLSRHNHWTPFAHTAISLRITCPIPIRTQCFKHKFGFVENEESRRYVSYTPNAYLPLFREYADNKKQGSGPVMENRHQDFIQGYYKAAIEDAIGHYEFMLQNGVCEEQARFVLPQGVMVSFIWTGSLSAFARFYRQRTAPYAQAEIQELAKKVGALIQPLFPFAWEALTSED